MNVAGNVFVVIVALQHVFFLVLEMFLFDKPFGMKVFRTTPEFASQAKVLAMNQGLYNGFLAAGLVWGLLARDEIALEVKTFFLACVVVAGVYGGFTVNPRIAVIQAVPALIALALLWVPRLTS